tara:strand:+ start:4765 stop:5343 length:579 start_codon:yes stop_codon:yes gene_type:complete
MDTKYGYPLMKKEEVDYILAHLDKDKTVFEWGTGHSTVFFSKHCKTIYSVEHDKYWVNKVHNMAKEENLKNITVRLQPPNKDYKIFENGHSRLLDDRVQSFRSYIKCIDKFGKKKYDFFIIDGRARVECAEYCLKYCDKNTIVFLQEFHRPRYKQALEWYDLIEQVGSMAVLKVKEKFINWQPVFNLARIQE